MGTRPKFIWRSAKWLKGRTDPSASLAEGLTLLCCLHSRNFEAAVNKYLCKLSCARDYAVPELCKATDHSLFVKQIRRKKVNISTIIKYTNDIKVIRMFSLSILHVPTKFATLLLGHA